MEKSLATYQDTWYIRILAWRRKAPELQMLTDLAPRARETSTKEEVVKYRPEYDMKVIGSNLRRLREAKQLSVEDVREYLRLGSVQAVYKYERGKGYPQTDTMFALMELYEADLQDIISDHEIISFDQESSRQEQQGSRPRKNVA